MLFEDAIESQFSEGVKITSKFYKPAFGLEQYIFWYGFIGKENMKAGQFTEIIKPDPCVYLVITPGGNATYFLKGSGKKGDRISDSFVIGPREYSSNAFVHLAAERNILIAFKPSSFFELFSMPVREFTNNAVSTKEFCGYLFDEILQEICSDAITDVHIVHLLDSFFLKLRKSEPSPFLNEIRKLTLIIGESHGKISVHQLLSHTNLSQKTIERYFLYSLGLTPKEYIRLHRLFSSIALLEASTNNDWLGIAIESGFYDYSHFIKEFSRMMGTTPSDYWRKLKAFDCC